MIYETLLLIKFFLFICITICLIPAGTTGLFFYICYSQYQMRRYLATLCTLWAMFATFVYFIWGFRSIGPAVFFVVFALISTPVLVKFRLWWLHKSQSNAHPLIETVYFPISATLLGIIYFAAFLCLMTQMSPRMLPSIDIVQILTTQARTST